MMVVVMMMEVMMMEVMLMVMMVVMMVLVSVMCVKVRGDAVTFDESTAMLIITIINCDHQTLSIVIIRHYQL